MCADNKAKVTDINVRKSFFIIIFFLLKKKYCMQQNRLQVIVKGLLPDSQCDFRKGRGCTAIIFAARQLMEKTWEHGNFE